MRFSPFSYLPFAQVKLFVDERKTSPARTSDVDRCFFAKMWEESQFGRRANASAGVRDASAVDSASTYATSCEYLLSKVSVGIGEATAVLVQIGSLLARGKAFGIVVQIKVVFNDIFFRFLLRFEKDFDGLQ